MFTTLLDVLKQGKTCSVQDLSVLLKTDIPTVKARLEYLERQGYIKRVLMNAGCGGNCFGCKGCSQGVSLPVMWQLVK